MQKENSKFKGQMEVFNFDEDIWVYSRLNIIDILFKNSLFWKKFYTITLIKADVNCRINLNSLF